MAKCCSGSGMAAAGIVELKKKSTLEQSRAAASLTPAILSRNGMRHDCQPG